MPYFKRVPKEYFENEACFIFVNEGEFSVRSQTEYLQFRKGKGLLAKCMNYFFETDEAQRSSGEGVEVIGVLLYPSLVRELFQFDITRSAYTVDFNLKQVQVEGLLENYKESISILLDHPELADEPMIRTKLKEFVLLVSKTQQAPSQLDFLAALFRPRHAGFRETIAKNIYSSLSLDQLASLCHMSTSSFKRKFVEVFDESPKKYITRMKLQKASAMLKDEGLRISDIAWDCGFESLATFNRTFRTHFGTSPSDYRLD